MRLPKLESKIGNDGWASDPLGGEEHFIIKDEIQHRRKDGMSKQIYVFQLLRYDDGWEQFRLGYYVIGKKPGMAGKWVWGQYAAMLPEKDFKMLIKLAQERGWVEC